MDEKKIDCSTKGAHMAEDKEVHPSFESPPKCCTYYLSTNLGWYTLALRGSRKSREENGCKKWGRGPPLSFVCRGESYFTSQWLYLLFSSFLPCSFLGRSTSNSAQSPCVPPRTQHMILSVLASSYVDEGKSLDES